MAHTKVSISDPPKDAITPTLDVAFEPCTCFWVGTSGDVSFVLVSGSTRVFKSVAAGMWHPLQAIKVNTSGTTAADILIGY